MSGVSSHVWEQNTPKQVHHPSPAVVGKCLWIYMLQTLTKVLPEPRKRYPCGAATSCLWRKWSPKKGLNSFSPTVRPAVPDNLMASNTQTKELLGVLKHRSHLSTR
jgi:hypothetical protein